MADEQQTLRVNKLRKLRKKLRQIENLQRLCGLRELTEEEAAKVDRRDEIREELQELLSLALDEDQKMESQEKTLNEEEATQDADDDDDDIVTQEKKQAQQEDVIDVKLESQKSNEDAVMESENEIQENFEKEKDKQPKEGQIQQKTEVNETDDRKVEKTGKKKGSKRKVENPKHWKQMHFALRVIEGHHHPLCAVDFNQDIIISGGHDTSLKVWNASNYEEVFSLGGHTGSISAVLLISEEKAVTGSQDCSVRIWDVKSGKSLSSVYVYNPVTCLAHNSNGILAIGNEGGKIDIYNIEKEALTISTKAFDEPLVSLAFMDDGKLACASADGVVKTFEIGNTELIKVTDTYDDITSITSFKNDVSTADTPDTSMLNLPLRKINCIASFKTMIFWGDDGYNVKAFEIDSGRVIKLRNNLNEYSPTDAMTVLKDGDTGYLFSAGLDIDTGSGYINVRKLPEMDYLGTISDGTLGHVSCISASVVGGKIYIVTGGSELRVWSQANNGKKRRASDELADVIPCKFVCSYNKARDSEEEESESEAETENESVKVAPAEMVEEKKSWCVIQ